MKKHPLPKKPKKNLKEFLLNEEGGIRKKDAAILGASALILGATLPEASAQITPNPPQTCDSGSIHFSSYAHVSYYIDTGAGGHQSTYSGDHYSSCWGGITPPGGSWHISLWG